METIFIGNLGALEIMIISLIFFVPLVLLLVWLTLLLVKAIKRTLKNF